MSDQQDRSEQAAAGILDAGDIGPVFAGELIVSYDGLSQYGRHSPSAGQSACGLAAMNCTRLAFEHHNDGVSGEDLIRWLSSRRGAEKIISICELWNNPSHLDVEDILQVPYFSNSINLVETHYELCELASFRTLLLTIQKISTLSAVIITKPPEIVACMKIPTSFGDVFLVFDSHVRPNHPNGAGFIFNSSIDATANYLSRLFWVDETSPTAKDDSYGFHMDLIRQFCGYIVVPKPSLKEDLALTQSLLDASMRILALTTELADSKATISSMRAELQRINHRFVEPPNATRDWTQSKKQRDSSRSIRKGKVASSSGEHVMQGSYDIAKNTDRTASCSNTTVENDYQCAVHLQEDLKREDQGSFHGRNNRQHKRGEKLKSFPCMSCSNEGFERDMVCISPCCHRFCSNCLRDYLLSSPRQDRFPISCPMCAAFDKTSSKSGFIDRKILKKISLSEEDYQELQANILKVAPERQHDHRVSSETQSSRPRSFAQVVSKGKRQ